MAPRPSVKAERSSLYLLGGLAAATLVVLLWLRHRSQGLSAEQAGAPSVRRGEGSGAQQPSGGAASIPGNLPGQTVSQPNELQAQVQQTTPEATIAETPTVVGQPSPELGSAVSFAPPATYYSYGLVSPTWELEGLQVHQTPTGGTTIIANPPQPYGPPTNVGPPRGVVTD